MYSILVEIGGYVPQDFTYVTLIISSNGELIHMKFICEPLRYALICVYIQVPIYELVRHYY